MLYYYSSGDVMKKNLLDFLEFLKYEKKYSSLTVNNYKRDIEYFFLFLNDKNITDLKKVDYQILRKYLIHLHNHQYSKKTISRYISSLRTFFKFLFNESIITSNPTILISNPKLDKKLPNFLYTNDLEKLLQAPNIENFLGIRDSLILELLYSTGIRVSELVNIKIKDIDINERKIKILGKGSKERYVLFGNLCCKKLNKYLTESRYILDKKNNDFLLLNNRGEKITTRFIELMIKKYQKNVGISVKVTPHTLRHTFATHLLEGGADLKTVQELMGHESLSSTQVYTHITSERLRNVYLKSHPRSRISRK